MRGEKSTVLAFCPNKDRNLNLYRKCTAHWAGYSLLSPFATITLADGAYVECPGVDVAGGITIGRDKILRQISYERGLYARTTF